MVCDQSGSNRGLINQLEISDTNPSFHHPSFPHPIFVFYDVPHCIKNLRTNMLRRGLVLPNGKKINYELFKKIIQADNEEFQANRKISMYHIEVKSIRCIII